MEIRAEFLVRSQELGTTFCPTGSVWWARCADLLAQKTFYGSPYYLAEIDANRGVDLDDEEDLRLAELLVLGLTARDGRSPLEPMKEELLQPRTGLRNKMICTIPARGGSKRLPRKNVRELAGRPLIAYSIEAALEAGYSMTSTFVPKTKRLRGPQRVRRQRAAACARGALRRSGGVTHPMPIHCGATARTRTD